MASESCLHRRGDSERFVKPAQVVIHEVEGDSVSVILYLLAESIRQACESPHRHPHCQVLSFNKRCANLVRMRIATNHCMLTIDNRCWAVACACILLQG